MLDLPDPHDKQIAAHSLSACRRQSRRAGAFLWVHAPDIGHRPPVPPLGLFPARGRDVAGKRVIKTLVAADALVR
jgi:hypothetical protein